MTHVEAANPKIFDFLAFLMSSRALMAEGRELTGLGRPLTPREREILGRDIAVLMSREKVGPSDTPREIADTI